MVDRSDPPRRPRRPPLPPRTRRRWALAGGGAATWLCSLLITRSVLAGTALALAVAVLAVVTMMTARSLGISRDHPWTRRLASRPWRDGHDVLMAALRHLPGLFVLTPTGSWLAPNVVEVHMHPDDHAHLTEVMDPAVIRSSANEIYQAHVLGYAARLAGPGPAGVRVLADEAVPPGRYRLAQGRDGLTIVEDQTAPWGPEDRPTARDDQRLPLLRLVTGQDVTHTRESGAQAGRGSSAELRLPQILTISRVHATFTFSDGHWWITGIGRNGLLLNGSRLTEPRVVNSGDRVRWGTHAEAVMSLIQIDG